MKLSMWILLDELEGLNPRCHIRSGLMTIESFRWFSDDGAPAQDCLCIGPAGDFFGGQTCGTVLAHRQDILLVDGDAREVFNRVIDVFERYRAWDEKLRLAMFDSHPYQAVMDAAHDMFRCAMLFGSRNLHIYALTQQYPKEAVYEEWDDVKNLMTMPFQFLERWKYLHVPHLPDDVDPAFFPVWPGMKFEHQIRTNCYLDGKVWGHLYLYYNKKEVSPSVPQLTRHVADIYGLILQRTQVKSSERYAAFSWLVDLLDGKDVQPGTLQALYWLLNWQENETLSLCRIAPPDRSDDEMLFNWLCDSLSEQCGGAAVFPYKNTVVIIVRESGNHPKMILDSISRLISVNSYHCGVSFTFQGLRHIASFYAQAGYAIRYAPDRGGKIHYFKDCPLPGVAGEMKARLHWQDWVPPSLYRLLETDAAQGTAYYDTLYYLLLNKWHLGNTAKALYIHRNTLLYRLERIEYLMDLDIHDEAVWAYLRLCYTWLKDDHPIQVPAQPDSTQSNG